MGADETPGLGVDDTLGLGADDGLGHPLLGLSICPQG